MALKASDIGLRALPWLDQVRGLKLLGVRYAPFRGAVAQYPAFLRNDDPNYPLAPLQRERWRAKPTDTLWWFIITSSFKFKKSTRVWTRRRFHDAMEAVLQERGYDRNGRRVYAHQVGQYLDGRLDITPFQSSLTAKFEELKQELNTALSYVESQVERNRSRARKLEAQSGAPGGSQRTRGRLGTSSEVPGAQRGTSSKLKTTLGSLGARRSAKDHPPPARTRRTARRSD